MIIIIIVLAYCLVIWIGYVASDRIIFRPSAASYQDVPGKILKLKTRDGETISAVYEKAPGAFYTLLYSHGNGADLGTARPRLAQFKQLGFNVFAYDYHGYGTSTGTPSENNTYRDIDAAYEYLTNELRVASDRVIAYGRSLGGAVAIDLASRRAVAGLIVESSFVSAFRVKTRFSLSPLDKFKSIAKIREVKCPVLIMHGSADTVIPPWHGKRLFEKANEPKISLVVSGADHGNLLELGREQYCQSVGSFLSILMASRNSMPETA